MQKSALWKKCICVWKKQEGAIAIKRHKALWLSTISLFVNASFPFALDSFSGFFAIKEMKRVSRIKRRGKRRGLVLFFPVLSRNNCDENFTLIQKIDGLEWRRNFVRTNNNETQTESDVCSQSGKFSGLSEPHSSRVKDKKNFEFTRISWSSFLIKLKRSDSSHWMSAENCFVTEEKEFIHFVILLVTSATWKSNNQGGMTRKKNQKTTTSEQIRSTSS